jgi:membrane-associated phospholipid phosphatase
MWIFVLSGANLILFLFSLIFFLPKGFYKKIPKLYENIFTIIQKNILPLAIIFGVVAFHLIEVRFIDPIITNWVGYDYANTLESFENGIVYSFSNNWTPALVYFFVIIYIGIYPFTLWFFPLYFTLSNKKRALKYLAYGLLLIYIIALPFYLFVPITNVYTFFGAESALESVIPSVESFFYATTTQNNCLPSLHTAMTILIAYTVSLTGNKKMTYFSYIVAIGVIISVIYLSIHWLTDVLAGALLSLAVIFILHRYIRD